MGIFIRAKIFILIFLNLLTAQELPSARNNALANSDITECKDVFSLFINPAAMANTTGTKGGLYYSPSPFGLKELSTGYAGIISKVYDYSAGIGLKYFGFSDYNDCTVYLSVSKKTIEEISVGLSVKYSLLKIKNYGSKSSLLINSGIIIPILSSLNIGFTVDNICISGIAEKDSNMPLTLKAGINYRYKNTAAYAAIESTFDLPKNFNFGIEYQPIQHLRCRIGISENPSKFCCGFGVFYNSMNINYSLANHSELGSTHTFDFIFNLK